MVDYEGDEVMIQIMTIFAVSPFEVPGLGCWVVPRQHDPIQTGFWV